jgi:hypothetical protein
MPDAAFVVWAAAEFTLHLKVCAFLKACGAFGEFSEGQATALRQFAQRSARKRRRGYSARCRLAAT